MKPVDFVERCHVERRGGGGAFHLITVDMKGAPIGQPMDQRRIAVMGKGHRLVSGEYLVEIAIAQAMRMLAWGLQSFAITIIARPFPYIDAVGAMGCGGIDTSESMPVEKTLGHNLIGGTLDQSGLLCFTATRVG